MANNKIQLKRSTTSGNVPLDSQLAQGELAINLPDRRLFTKDSTDTVIDVFGQSVNTTANVQFKNGVFTGTVSVTGNVSATGAIATTNTVTGSRLISTVVNGTSPLNVSSTTVVTNLNADYLDGQHGAYYSNVSNATGTLAIARGGTGHSLSAVSGGVAFSNTTGIAITPAGTAGQVLVSNGTSAPVWTNQSALSVGSAWTVNNGVYTTGSYIDPSWIVSLSASKVGLGNVTNESKETMFSSPTFTGTVTANNDVLIRGNLTVQGTQFVSSSNTTGYSTNFLNLHSPATGWIVDNDGYDIGLVYNHYEANPVYIVITGGSGNGTTATLNVDRGGTYAVGMIVEISGIEPAGFNGTYKITAVTPTSFSYNNATVGSVVVSGSLGRATRITRLTITGGTTETGSKISTINYSSALALTAGDVVTISGCTPNKYNGTWTVLTSSAGTFTFQNLVNLTPITIPGFVVLGHRYAFSGWSNDEKAFEFYRVGSATASGTFTGIYGTIKGAQFHAAPPPGVASADLAAGLAFKVPVLQVWDANTASGGTLPLTKVVGVDQLILNSTQSNVTYTTAASVYIANAPANGHNVSITNRYALQVAAGTSYFGGNVAIQGTINRAPTITTNVTGDVTGSGSTTLTDLANGTISITATLANTTVTAGTYGNTTAYPVVTVDSKGRITGVSLQTVSATGAGVTSFVYTAANTTLSIGTSGGDLHATLPLANDVVAGLVTLINSTSNTSTTAAATAAAVKTAYDAAITANNNAANAAFLTSGTLSTDRLPALSGDVTSTVGSGILTLVNTAVVAGTYGNSTAIPSITVDSKGRITGATTTSVASISAYSYSAANNTFTIDTSSGTSLHATLNEVKDFLVSGNLTVSGTTTYINTTQLNVGDNIITLNADLPVGSAPSESAGIEVNRGSSANVQLVWNETNDQWDLGNTYVTGTFTATANVLVNTGTLFVDTVAHRVGIGNTQPTAPLTIGNGSALFTNPIVQLSGNANSYIQINGQNANTGNNASSDLMLVADSGTDTTNYIDIGINSSTYNQTTYSIMKPLSGYVFVNGGELTIGTQTAHAILFHTGNTTSASQRMVIAANGNVGIGNTTPGELLTVGGTGRVTSNFTVGGALTVYGAAHTILGNVNIGFGTLFVNAVLNRVGIGCTNPSSVLTVVGNTYVSGAASFGNTVSVANTLSHGGLVPSTGTGIDQIYSASDVLTLTTAWQDTSVNAAELATGTYIVQVLANDRAVGGGQVSTYYSGVMSWYAADTDEATSDEVVLHRAGQASGSGTIFLRILRTLTADAADMKLQIAGTTTNSGTATYTFKFRRMI